MGQLIHISSWRSAKDNIAVDNRRQAASGQTLKRMRGKLRELMRSLPEPFEPTAFGWESEKVQGNIIGWFNSHSNLRVGECYWDNEMYSYLISQESCYDYAGINMVELIVGLETGCVDLDSARIEPRYLP